MGLRGLYFNKMSFFEGLFQDDSIKNATIFNLLAYISLNRIYM